MAQTRAPRRRTPAHAHTIDPIDRILAAGYESLRSLPEEERLTALLIPIAELDREWTHRRDRLVAEADAGRWSLPLAWETYRR